MRFRVMQPAKWLRSCPARRRAATDRSCTRSQRKSDLGFYAGAVAATGSAIPYRRDRAYELRIGRVIVGKPGIRDERRRQMDPKKEDPKKEAPQKDLVAELDLAS